MLYNLTDLKGSTINARDGEIGEVEDFYFDDDNWTIRYLVVSTGSWLGGRRVLVSPHAVGGARKGERKIDVNLSKEQVENSPGINSDKPVSRQYETTYFNYYGYPYYWGGPYLWGPAAVPAAMPPPVPERTQDEIREMQRREQESADPHLHSANEVIGRYYIEATDGDIGTVSESSSEVGRSSIVVDTGMWIFGKKRLIPAACVQRVDHANRRIDVSLTKDQIKDAPDAKDLTDRDTRDDDAYFETHAGYYRPWL